MSKLILSPGHQQTIYPQDPHSLLLSQEVSTSSTTAQCFVVRVTFHSTSPPSTLYDEPDDPHSMAITTSLLVEDDIIDETGTIKPCSAIPGAQCIDPLVILNVHSFQVCGVTAFAPRMMSQHFTIFPNQYPIAIVQSVDIINLHAPITSRPSIPISIAPRGESGDTFTGWMDLTRIHTAGRGLMLKSQMTVAQDCTLNIRVCDLFQPERCSVIDTIDEDEEWESDYKHCIATGSMQSVIVTNIGSAACRPALAYRLCPNPKPTLIDHVDDFSDYVIGIIAIMACVVTFIMWIGCWCNKMERKMMETEEAVEPRKDERTDGDVNACDF